MRKVIGTTILLLCGVMIFGLSEAANLQAQENSPVWRITLSLNNPNPSFRDIHCADSLHCIISAWYGVGIESLILATSDGGQTWRKVYRDTGRTSPLRWPLLTDGVAYPAPNLAIVVADSGYIQRTTDGGATWEERRIVNPELPVERGPISMCDSLHGVVLLTHPLLDSIGSLPFMMSTSDGGLTWHRLTTPEPPSTWASQSLLIKPFCIAPDHYLCLMYGVQRRTAIALTDDDGQTWTYVLDPFPGGLKTIDPAYIGLQFFDARLGVLAGGDYSRRSVFARTSDGGHSWALVHNDSIGGWLGEMNTVFFRDSLHGVAGGDDAVFRTSDGGVTWSRDSVQGSTWHGSRLVADGW
jgi:photosystem II stability/assembly factor-like uncharacterized protein